MAFDGLVIDSQRPVIDGYGKGPSLAFPFLYAGNWLGRSRELDKTYGKSTVDDDECPTSTLDFGNAGESQDVIAFKDAEQCFKRINLEVAHFPAAGGKLVPDPGDPARDLESTMWEGIDAARRIEYNFLFNLETLDLYCGGDGNGHGIQPPKIEELGRVGVAKTDYYNGPFPARGLPIKFQKVYFYGTRGQISGHEEKDVTKPFNDREQSDGRGALFSTYILCASTAVNSLNREGGNDGAGYMPEELSSYDLQGGTFTYLKEPRYSSSDFFLTQQAEYNEGIDVKWDPQDYATDAPLIIGDGALGFREESLGEQVFGKVDIYEVTEASKYYEQQITLCIDGDNVTGTILFKPLDPSGFSESDSKMLIHDMRNTFSCTGIVPTGDCEDGDCLYEGGLETPLPHQHEKVQIIDKTSLLLRTDVSALDDISSTNKCASD